MPSRWVARVAWFLALFVGGVFLAAAFAKAWDASGFVRVLAYLMPLPLRDFSLIRATLIVVVAWEALLGAALILGVGGRAMLWAVITTLVAFSAVLVSLSMDPAAPGCGCLGLLQAARDAQQDAGRGLARNAAMLWMTGSLVFMGRGPARGPGSAPQEPSPGRPGPRRAGFTLIELLLVIAVCAILIALILPGLAQSRYRAGTVRSLAMQRQLLAGLSLYASDFRDGFPYFATPGDPLGPVTIEGFVLTHPEGYFRDLSWYWVSMVCPSYFSSPRGAVEDDRARQKIQDLYGYPEQVILSYYMLTHAAAAAPRFWSDDADGEPNLDSRLLHGTRLTDTAFPSRKGFILDISRGFLYPKHGFDRDDGFSGMGDGSARQFSWERDVDWGRVAFRPHGAHRSPVLATRGGLGGIDF